MYYAVLISSVVVDHLSHLCTHSRLLAVTITLEKSDHTVSYPLVISIPSRSCNSRVWRIVIVSRYVMFLSYALCENCMVESARLLVPIKLWPWKWPLACLCWVLE